MVAMTLLVVTEPKPPTEWPRIEKPPAGRRSGSSVALQRQRVVDADAEEVAGRRAIMLSKAAMMSPGRTSRLPRPAAPLVDARDAVDLLLAVLAGHGVAEGGLDLARQVVARGRERVVHALEDGEGPAVLERLDDLPGREGPEARRRSGSRPAMPLRRAGNRRSPWPSPCSSPCRRGCTRRRRSGRPRRSRSARPVLR